MASYTVGSTVTLACVVDPVITSTRITPMYSWQCDTSCFADGMTTPTITRQLTDMDSGLIECSVTINGDEYMSDMFDLQVSQGIKMYVILHNYAYSLKYVAGNVGDSYIYLVV